MRVLVTGATGFVGRHVSRILQERDDVVLHETSLSSGVDLRESDSTDALFAELKPQKVINCAAYVGGIHFGLQHEADLFRNNLLISLNLLHAAATHNVERLLNPIANCAYPAHLSYFKEEEFWDGPLHDSVLVYGFVRKGFWVGSHAYRRQHGLDVINLVVSNMFGPGDHMDAERCHALGGMILRVLKAQKTGARELVVWGTGTPVREWLYVGDGAEALVRGLSAPAADDPVNVGVGKGISIGDLARRIAEIAEFDGDIVFDTDRPDGAAHKTMDGTRGRELLGWQPDTPFDDALRKTVDWFREQVR